MRTQSTHGHRLASDYMLSTADSHLRNRRKRIEFHIHRSRWPRTNQSTADRHVPAGNPSPEPQRTPGQNPPTTQDHRIFGLATRHTIVGLRYEIRAPNQSQSHSGAKSNDVFKFPIPMPRPSFENINHPRRLRSQPSIDLATSTIK